MTARTILSLTAAATMVATSLGIAAPASAQRYDNGYRDGGYSRDYRDQGGYQNRGYQNRGRDYRDQRNYQNRRYAYGNQRCSDGATGTILGAIAGGLIGSSVAGRHGDKTAGVLVGGAVGAVAGRAIDKNGNGCR